MIVNEVVKGFTTIIAIDTAKTVFQVLVANEKTNKITNKKVTRSHLINYLIRQGKAVIFMEACTASHYWGRKLQALGFIVKLIDPKAVKQSLKNKDVKNDIKDARAIYATGMKDDTHFVPIKTLEQQNALLIHSLRSSAIKRRVALSNRLRGLLAEFGSVVAKGRRAFENEFLFELEKVKEDIAPALYQDIQDLYHEYLALKTKEKEYEQQIIELNIHNEGAKLLKTCPGVGELTANAIVTAVGDGSQFKKGREMAAWMGLTPRQHSSGGKNKLGKVTKKGDTYLRTLLTQCAQTILVWAEHKEQQHTASSLHNFALRLLRRGKYRNTVVIALANKMARVLWAMLKNKRAFTDTVTTATVAAV